MSEMPNTATLFTLGVSTVVFATGLPLFWTRRNKFPLTIRPLAEVATVGLVHWLYSISIVWVDLIVFCFPYLPIRVLQETIVSMVFSVRLWRIVNKYRIRDAVFQIGALARQDSLTDESKEAIVQHLESWFVRNRTWNEWPFLIMVLVSQVVLNGVVVYAIAVAIEHDLSRERSPDTSLCFNAPGGYFLNLYMGCYLGFQGILSIVFLCLLRGSVQDSYGLRAEVSWCCLVIVIDIVHHIVVHAIPDLFGDYATFFELWLTCALSGVMFYFPLYLASREDSAKKLAEEALRVLEAKRPRGDNAMLRVQDIMADRTGREALAKFMQGEFSQENLVFLEEVAKLRKLIGTRSHAEIVDGTLRIIKDYIAPDAALRINIKSATLQALLEYTRPALEAKADGELVLVFEEAQLQVWALVVRDTWPRFQRTPAYRQYVLSRDDNLVLERFERLTSHAPAEAAGSEPPASHRRTISLANLRPKLPTMTKGDESRDLALAQA